MDVRRDAPLPMQRSLPRFVSRPSAARGWWAIAIAAALGFAGLVPRELGGVDPFVMLAWAMLLAAPAGYACGALGVRLLPMGLAPPAVWMMGLVQADLVGERDVAATIAPGLLWTGVFLFGLGLGGARDGRGVVAALRGAGLLLALGAALAWLGVLTGVATGASGFAAAHPDAQARLCELSPLAPLFDAAGWDWMRANALSYRLAGAEWVARSPWNGALAATAGLVVGCTSALLLPVFGRRGDVSARR